MQKQARHRWHVHSHSASTCRSKGLQMHSTALAAIGLIIVNQNALQQCELQWGHQRLLTQPQINAGGNRGAC